MEPNQPLQISDGEISLKDVILTIKDHLREVRSRISTLLIFLSLSGLYFIYHYLTDVTEYVAECSFMLNEKENSLGISNILGEFGLGGGNEFRLEKIVELAKTRTMTASVMFEEAEIDGQNDFLANHFINTLEGQNEWIGSSFLSKNDELHGFRFESNEMTQFSRLENRALQTLNRRLKERLSTDISDITGILKFSFVSTDEGVSYEVMHRLYSNLGDYYTNKRIEKQEATYRTIAAKCDSIETALNAKEYELARFRDTHRSQWLNIEKTTEDKLYREIKMLGIMYGEALKNKEVAAFSLANVRPFIQSIDLPLYPLKRHEFIWWRQLIVCLIVGLLVGVAWIALGKLYDDIMAV